MFIKLNLRAGGQFIAPVGSILFIAGDKSGSQVHMSAPGYGTPCEWMVIETPEQIYKMLMLPVVFPGMKMAAGGAVPDAKDVPDDWMYRREGIPP